MADLINLVLLYGGKSGEHEISLLSASSVLANLDASRYGIIPIGMDKAGQFFLNDYEELKSHKGPLPVKTAQSRQLDALISAGKLAIDADVVFPVVHGPLYEDGCLQGLLELAGVAYVGCDVLSSAIGMDKDLSRRVAALWGVKSTQYRVFSSGLTETAIKEICQDVVENFAWPLFVKPCSMGSSVGIHKVQSFDKLFAAVKDAARFDSEVLIEAFVKGREIEVSVLESQTQGEPPRVSIPGEIKVNHQDGFYSYSAKYFESDQTELLIPAVLNDRVSTKLQQAAQTVFTALKCKGLARVDFFIDDESEEIYFNEINTLPGFTTFSMYPKLWEASGLPYSLLLDELIQIALMHQKNRKQLVTSYQ